MAMLTDFVVAPVSSTAKVLAGTNKKTISHYQTRGIDPTRIAALGKLLNNEGETTLLTDEDAEQWVFRVSPSLVVLLANLDSIGATAKRWNAAFKPDGWTHAMTKLALSVLVALSKNAVAKK